ncbi:MAG TPA: hypothetical protein DCG30_01475 [Ruminococcus sp.]|nr:hypothetical protein [Ruminococcus sp.]
MKLNYREKVILGILLAVIILIAGFVGLVKPKSQDIEDDTALRETKRTEQQEVQDKIDQIEPLKKKIDATYQETNKLAEDFVPMEEINDTYMLDQYMREYADDSEVKILDLQLEELNSQVLKYYYFTPEVLSEDLFAASDLNGDAQTAFDQLSAESNSLSERTEEEVVGTQYAVKVKGTREHVWAYMKAIEEIGDARIISSVKFQDYSFGELMDDTVAEGEGETEVDFIVSFYSVYEMAKPDTEAD